MSRDPRPENAVGLRLELAPADRDRLMIAAAKAGKSMASHARDVILAHLDAVEPAKKPRGKKGDWADDRRRDA
jgi:hypothetical protein